MNRLIKSEWLRRVCKELEKFEQDGFSKQKWKTRKNYGKNM